MVKKAAAPSHEDEVAEETKKIVPEKQITVKEITTFLTNRVNDATCLLEFASMVRRSPCTAQVLKTINTTLFGFVRDSLADLPWIESVIHITNAEMMWPHNPIHEALFFPSDDNEYKILHYIKASKTYINLCVFALSNDTLVDELIEAHKRGVIVRAISDDEQQERSGADISRLNAMGIQGRIDFNPKVNMHHKFCVVDGTILMTGSFNWTKQAVEKNQENLIIVDDTVLIKAYNQEFEKLWVEFAPAEQAPKLNISVQKFVDTLVGIFRKNEEAAVSQPPPTQS